MDEVEMERMTMTLMQLMNALKEDGVVGDEYEERVAEFIARRKATEGDAAAIVRRGHSGIERKLQPHEIPFPMSVQETGLERRRRDLPDNETAAEAELRWLQEEAADPDGVLSPGGMSAGGIFGSGAIATSGYDPEARQRAVPIINARLQAKQLEVMDRLVQRLDASEARNRELEERERALLEGRQPRQLKKRRR